MTIIEPGATGHPARWWIPDGSAVLCQLCPRGCRVPDGGTGFCNARTNVNGELRTLTYGQVCASTVDPVEKKPVFHFRPGSRLFSVGTFGCNLDCDFCQNAVLARSLPEEIPSRYVPPEELVHEALEKGADGIGWTFNDPIVWSEYVIDSSKQAHERGLFSLLNTNGYIETEATDDLLECIDAVKVDIKGFEEMTYRELCQGKLGPVLDTCVRIKDKGIHLELAYPFIPGRTDDPGMLKKFANWVREELGPDTPIHLFRFQPAYRLSAVPSPGMAELHACRALLTAAGLRYVYLGGVTGVDQDTRCPECGAVVVSRRSEESSEKIFIKKEQVSRFCPTFSKVQVLTRDGRCPECGEAVPIRFNKLSG